MSDRTPSEPTGVPAKPLPVLTPTSEPFWAALAAERVVIQHCRACDRYVFYPRSHCPGCLAHDMDWREVSGRGHVHSFTVAREPTSPLFADEAPQLLVIIELDEGPRLTSTIVGSDPSSLAIGLSVEPVFDHCEGGVTLLRYRIAAG